MLPAINCADLLSGDEGNRLNHERDNTATTTGGITSKSVVQRPIVGINSKSVLQRPMLTPLLTMSCPLLGGKPILT
jgi:hypothetical protein